MGINGFFQVSVDDLIVFSGEVPTSTTEKTGILRVSLRE